MSCGGEVSQDLATGWYTACKADPYAWYCYRLVFTTHDDVVHTLIEEGADQALWDQMDEVRDELKGIAFSSSYSRAALIMIVIYRRNLWRKFSSVLVASGSRLSSIFPTTFFVKRGCGPLYISVSVVPRMCQNTRQEGGASPEGEDECAYTSSHQRPRVVVHNELGYYEYGGCGHSNHHQEGPGHQHTYQGVVDAPTRILLDSHHLCCTLPRNQSLVGI